MENNKYLEFFTDLKVKMDILLSEIKKGIDQDIHSSYLSFLDNFLVLVDQIITEFDEGKKDDEGLALMMTERQNNLMSTLSKIISNQKEGNWEGVSTIIKTELDKDLIEWKESVISYFHE